MTSAEEAARIVSCRGEQSAEEGEEKEEKEETTSPFETCGRDVAETSPEVD